MSSTEILLDNLKRHYLLDSSRALARKMNLSESLVLNWSSGRSSPSIKQIDEIAYMLGVEVYQLLILNNIFSVTTPVWKDKVEQTLIKNLGKLKLERDIHESSFYQSFNQDSKMGYRTFLRYVNGQNSNVNLEKLDRLAKILSVDTYELLESEKKNEKKNFYK